MDTNAILNGAYHSATLGGLMMANSMIGKKLLNIKPADLGQLSFRDSSMLMVNIYIAMMTKRMLINQGILPPNINPS